MTDKTEAELGRAMTIMMLRDAIGVVADLFNPGTGVTIIITGNSKTNDEAMAKMSEKDRAALIAEGVKPGEHSTLMILHGGQYPKDGSLPVIGKVEALERALVCAKADGAGQSVEEFVAPALDTLKAMAEKQAGVAAGGKLN